MERQAINSAIINYLSSYGPERIGLFGSFARQEEDINSDIDILVKFKETITHQLKYERPGIYLSPRGSLMSME